MSEVVGDPLAYLRFGQIHGAGIFRMAVRVTNRFLFIFILRLCAHLWCYRFILGAGFTIGFKIGYFTSDPVIFCGYPA